MKDPIERFCDRFEAAKRTEKGEPTAVTLATATPDARPSARIVLLKGVSTDGFDFFTNYGSSKASDLMVNPFASLCFFWPILEEQIRVQGKVARLSRNDSETYFQSRPRESQIGAWASRQSASLESVEDLQRRFEEYENQFEGKEVPCPSFWGGFRLDPERIEFWKAGAHRLHHRELYCKQSAGHWNHQWLFP